MDKHKQITSYLNNLVKQFNKGKKQSINQFKTNTIKK